MNEALERLRRAVVRMDDVIRQSGGPWLLGARITLADVAIMPVIVRMNDIRLAHLWSDLPAVARWFAAIQADPAFRPPYYEGALLTEKYPHLRATRELSGADPPRRLRGRCGRCAAGIVSSAPPAVRAPLRSLRGQGHSPCPHGSSKKSS